MKSYKTKQSEYILDMLKNSEGRHFTAEEMYAESLKNGYSVGQATVYRNLEKLAQSGEVLKYESGGKGACYSYLDCGGHEHYHMVCTKCGAVQHFDCENLDKLAKHFLQEHNFGFDMRRTVFYGICADCMKKQ